MALSNVRIGNPTSSDILDIVKFHTTKDAVAKGTIGTTFFSYLQDCRDERFLKQRIDKEVEVFATQWGKLCEKIVHQKLPNQLDYTFQSDETLEHGTIKGFYGTPDGKKWKEVLKKLKEIAVTDMKCPETKKAFLSMVRWLYNFDGVNVTKKPESEIDYEQVMKLIRENARDGEKFYWQLVSNADIVNVDMAELIVFMPFKSTLPEIMAHHAKLAEPFSAVWYKKEEELPFILDDNGLEEVNVIPFKVPIADREFLRMRVKMLLELISLDEKKYTEFIDLGIRNEDQVLKFIEETTGEKIAHVKRSA